MSPDDGTPAERSLALGTGLTYHVLEWGHAAPALDHTVILLHGFLDLAWGWVATVRAGLAGRFHVVAPDLRGHGDSDWVGPGGYYHFADYLADVDDLVRQLGRARVSLVGHSMGGSVAAYFAGACPDRIHSLVLMEGLGPPDQADPLPTRTRNWLDAWRTLRQHPARSYATVADAAARLRAHDKLLDPTLALELAEHGTRQRPDGRWQFKHDPLHTTPGPMPFRVAHAEEFWRAITCPVLLIEGESSVFRHAGPEAERRMQVFQAAQRATLPGAGHMMQRHQPAALAELLTAFLLRQR
ncbi:MAG TPA: alpha/beta hydrolase [Kofleriaceae bacterium]|nr:alpha/beta hydrolase [Kofleriaceae bacterium]